MNNFALVFSNPNKIVPITPANQIDFTLDECKLFIDGYIELHPKRFQGKLILCDEDARYKKLKLNEPFYKISNIEVFGNVILMPENLFK